jgi:catechol 2,3-dioxygenase-like lactoylglutathione lyase family enzyme
MPIDHIGLNVPDVDAALVYYDELLGMLGFVREWKVGYRTHDWYGAQLFIYPALESGDDSRVGVGLSHLAFFVHTRDEVERVHEWAVARDHEILHAPRRFPEYGPQSFALHFVDVHGFHIEVSTQLPAEG